MKSRMWSIEDAHQIYDYAS